MKWWLFFSSTCYNQKRYKFSCLVYYPIAFAMLKTKNLKEFDAPFLTVKWLNTPLCESFLTSSGWTPLSTKQNMSKDAKMNWVTGRACQSLITSTFLCKVVNLPLPMKQSIFCFGFGYTNETKIEAFTIVHPFFFWQRKNL